MGQRSDNLEKFQLYREAIDRRSLWSLLVEAIAALQFLGGFAGFVFSVFRIQEAIVHWDR